MRVLVTGGTGLIGTHLVQRLRALNWQVVCLVRKEVRWEDPEIQVVYADLADPAALEQVRTAIGPVDGVFHVGALLPDPAIPEASAYMQVNGTATRHLLEMARALQARFFVHFSTTAVYGIPRLRPVDEHHPLDPQTAYAKSKLCGEFHCRIAQYEQPTDPVITILRIPSPYGAGLRQGSILPFFIGQVLQGKEIHWFGSGSRTQNFIHIDDVVQACLLAARSRQPDLFLVGGPDSIPMKQLAEKIIALIPDSPSRATAVDRPDPQEGYAWELNLAHGQRQLGYRPLITLDEGLRDYIAYLRHPAGFRPWWSRS
ncbi:MAG: NAD(P)-dependent oxidoreductase [Magnetococcales bacterium]|nr:NAD(P)-dependent oxidoreductase [Magnetococcales bacterium]